MRLTTHILQRKAHFGQVEINTKSQMIIWICSKLVSEPGIQLSEEHFLEWYTILKMGFKSTKMKLSDTKYGFTQNHAKTSTIDPSVYSTRCALWIGLQKRENNLWIVFFHHQLLVFRTLCIHRHTTAHYRKRVQSWTKEIWAQFHEAALAEKIAQTISAKKQSAEYQ